MLQHKHSADSGSTLKTESGKYTGDGGAHDHDLFVDFVDDLLGVNIATKGGSYKGGRSSDQIYSADDHKHSIPQLSVTGEIGNTSSISDSVSASTSKTDLNMPKYLAVYMWKRTA